MNIEAFNLARRKLEACKFADRVRAARSKAAQ